MIASELDMNGLPSDEVISISVKNISAFQSVDELRYILDYANKSGPDIAPTLFKLINFLEVELLKNSIGQNNDSNLAKTVAL